MGNMSKNVTELYQGDMAHIEMYITALQPEGNYHYIPEAEDEIKLRIYNGELTICEFDADTTNTEFVYFHIDSDDIPPGEYIYDATLKTSDGEIYHIIKEEKLIVRR